MNIQDASGKRRYEIRREQPHVSRKAHEIDVLLFERRNNQLVERLALESLRGDHACFQAPSASLSIPCAPSRLLRTSAISASGMRPAATLSANASKLEPRPESRTAMRFFMSEKINTVPQAGKTPSQWKHASRGEERPKLEP